MKIIGELKAENASLKAEVERLTFDPLTYLDDGGEWMPRHTHLAAVERLNAEVDNLRKNADISPSQSTHELTRLKAEVERLDTLCRQLGKQHSDISCQNIMLRTAGDAMARHYQDVVRIEWGQMTTHIAPSIVRWLAAKEGETK